MTEEEFEKSNEESEKRKEYDELVLEFEHFKDVSTMFPHLCLYRKKIGKNEAVSMEITGKVMEVGINAMEEEFLKEMAEAQKGTTYERK